MIESKRELMETGSDTTQPAMNIQLVNSSQNKTHKGLLQQRKRRRIKEMRPVCVYIHTVGCNNVRRRVRIRKTLFHDLLLSMNLFLAAYTNATADVVMSFYFGKFSSFFWICWPSNRELESNFRKIKRTACCYTHSSKNPLAEMYKFGKTTRKAGGEKRN